MNELDQPYVCPDCGETAYLHFPECPQATTRIGDRVDQADDCPCLPGAPEHIHGAGGYAPTEG